MVSQKIKKSLQMAGKKKNVIGVLSSTFKDFFQSSAAGGIVLLICTALALLWANSSYSPYYFELWEQQLSLHLGKFGISKTLHHWINDGLMVIFFFMVGLEIKREIVVGELSSRLE